MLNSLNKHSIDLLSIQLHQSILRRNKTRHFHSNACPHSQSIKYFHLTQLNFFHVFRYFLKNRSGLSMQFFQIILQHIDFSNIYHCFLRIRIHLRVQISHMFLKPLQTNQFIYDFFIDCLHHFFHMFDGF